MDGSQNAPGIDLKNPRKTSLAQITPNVDAPSKQIVEPVELPLIKLFRKSQQRLLSLMYRMQEYELRRPVPMLTKSMQF